MDRKTKYIDAERCVLSEVDMLQKQINEKYHEIDTIAKEEAKDLNEVYKDFIGRRVKLTMDLCEKEGIFGGFKAHRDSYQKYMKVVPVLYTIKKDGTASKREVWLYGGLEFFDGVVLSECDE